MTGKAELDAGYTSGQEVSELAGSWEAQRNYRSCSLDFTLRKIVELVGKITANRGIPATSSFVLLSLCIVLHKPVVSVAA